MTTALIISIALNVLLLVLLALQRLGASLTKKATDELVTRVLKLEDTVKNMPTKVTIVGKEQQENHQ